MRKPFTIKLKGLSEISRDVGQVFFAGVVVEPILTHSLNSFSIISGFGLSVGFWFMSLIVIKNKI